MITEIYKGRKLRVKKGREWGTLACTINGTYSLNETGLDEQAAMGHLRAWIDMVDRDPVVDGGRWAPEMYAPGTYQLCPEGHPVALGGQCRHPYCTARNLEG
jgi:hypothetical protein